MGYGKQPYIVVFHNDTANNHVHIVSSRVNKENGKRIDRDFEKYQSQTALQETLKELYGTDIHKKLDKLLDYNYSNLDQLQKLLENSGYGCYEKENQLKITRNGVFLKDVDIGKINFSEKIFDDNRKKQIFALFKKYKEVYSNQTFKVSDEKQKCTSFQSELQFQLKKKFGIEVVFSIKDDTQPFGYTIIDHHTNTIYKGSEVMKIQDLFNFTSEAIDKKIFDILTNSNVTTETKEAFKKHLEDEYKCEVQDFMMFLKPTSKTSYKIWQESRDVTKDYIRNFGNAGNSDDKIAVINFANTLYVINKNENVIFNLKELVGDHYLNLYLSQSLNPQNFAKNPVVSGVQIPVSSSPEALLKLSSVFDIPGTASPTNEEHANNRRKKKKKR